MIKVNGFTRLYDLGLDADQLELCYHALAYYKSWYPLTNEQKASITEIMLIIETYLCD